MVLIFGISAIGLPNKERVKCLLSPTAGLLIKFRPQHWQTGSFNVHSLTNSDQMFSSSSVVDPLPLTLRIEAKYFVT